MIRVGIDIGGTFTDFAAWRQGEAEIVTFKLPSTAPNYARGFKEGFLEIVGRISPVPHEPIVVMHGTTITTNTVIERKGAAIALLVTKGFRDLLELERLKLRDPINLLASRPLPLVPRDRVFEIDERMDSDGTVVAQLDLDEVRAAAAAAVAAAVAAVEATASVAAAAGAAASAATGVLGGRTCIAAPTAVLTRS